MKIKASIELEFEIEVVETSDELDFHDFAATSEDDALQQVKEMFVEDVTQMVIRYPDDLWANVGLETIREPA